VLHILQCFSEHIKEPKKDWIRYEPPPQPPKEVHIIYAPLGPPRERPPIVDPLPFPNTARKHMLMQQFLDRQEAEKKAQEEKEELERIAKELVIEEEEKQKDGE
jgi:hypothetical protein